MIQAVIAAEQPPDRLAIEAILDHAFGPNRLAKRSYAFRTDIEPIGELCLVARCEDAITATIRYWPILVGTAPALLLGPVAVDSAYRCAGLGGRMIRHSLGLARESGHRLVVLVGDRQYYGRFGFMPAAPEGIVMPGEDPARVQYLDLFRHPDYAGDPASPMIDLGDGIIRRRESALLTGAHDPLRRIYAAA